jgi:hypothetical protein
MKTKPPNELPFPTSQNLQYLTLSPGDHAAPIDTFPLILTQGAKKLTNDAHPANATAIRNTALKPSI